MSRIQLGSVDEQSVATKVSSSARGETRPRSKNAGRVTF